MILVSACLLGEKCKYNGKDNCSPSVIDFIGDKEYITVCPEVLGGLPVPRSPAEIHAGRVMNANGEDVTKAFIDGARKTLQLAKENNVGLCILKEGSPSCGKNLIYDGCFRNRKIPGQGITAKLLQENGYKILSETELAVDKR